MSGYLNTEDEALIHLARKYLLDWSYYRKIELFESSVFVLARLIGRSPDHLYLWREPLNASEIAILRGLTGEHGLVIYKMLLARAEK